MLLSGVHRHLPRSRPGTGPTSKAEATLRAEVTQLAAEVTRLVREQQVQIRRYAEVQQELDEIKRLLRTLVREGPEAGKS